jgi:phage-related holin
MLCSFTSNQAFYIYKLYRFSRIIICVLIKLVLDTRQLIRETHIFAIYKDRGIRELSRARRGLFRC